MTEPETEQQPTPAGRENQRRDWIGRGLERLSRRTERSDPDQSGPRLTPPLIVALIVLTAVAGLTIGLIITGGDDETELEPTLLTLELTYPTTGEPVANLEGQPGAAPSGSRIVCRATSDATTLGEDRAADDGSFDVTLDATHWPLESLTGDSYQTLNTTLECRAGTGPWVQPLRPPRVAIN